MNDVASYIIGLDKNGKIVGQDMQYLLTKLISGKPQEKGEDVQRKFAAKFSVSKILRDYPR